MQFKTQLVQDFLTTRVDDFAPSGDHELRQRLADIKAIYWWKGIATHSLAAIVEKLKTIPDQHIDAAIENLLQLSAFPSEYPQ